MTVLATRNAVDQVLGLLMSVFRSLAASQILTGTTNAASHPHQIARTFTVGEALGSPRAACEIVLANAHLTTLLETVQVQGDQCQSSVNVPLKTLMYLMMLA